MVAGTKALARATSAVNGTFALTFSPVDSVLVVRYQPQEDQDFYYSSKVMTGQTGQASRSFVLDMSRGGCGFWRPHLLLNVTVQLAARALPPSNFSPIVRTYCPDLGKRGATVVSRPAYHGTAFTSVGSLSVSICLNSSGGIKEYLRLGTFSCG
jgi:hypothetical protein